MATMKRIVFHRHYNPTASAGVSIQTRSARRVAQGKNEKPSPLAWVRILFGRPKSFNCDSMVFQIKSTLDEVISAAASFVNALGDLAHPWAVRPATRHSGVA